MTDATMPASFRAALDAALSRPILLDPRALDPLRGAAGFRPRADASNGSSPSSPAPFTREGDVAVVSIEGPLSQRAWSCWMFDGDGYDAVTSRMKAAIDDRATRSVVMRIDSPGGEVAGCFEAVRTIRTMAKAAGKPLVAYADEMACSAAYALACACDEVVLPDTGMVGSVGVILTLASRAGELAQRGVSVTLLTSGAAKADGHSAVPLADDARARLQADVDHIARLFAAEVAASRPLDPAEVLALEARTFLGSEAVRAGLADHVGPMADAVARARALASRSPRTNTGARGAATTRNIMNEHQLAALAAATGETDPDKIVAAVTGMKERSAAAEGTITKLSADLSTANDRAAAAEKKLEAADRAHEVEAAKTEGKWSPALDGFLSTLSNDQLRAWRASAPRVVPGGQHDPPTDGPSPDAQLPADVAAIAAKAQTEGWGALSDREKHSLIVANKPLAQRLKAAAKNASTSA